MLPQFCFAATDNITYTIDISPVSSWQRNATRDKYRLVGNILGKAILERQAVGIHLTVPLLKLIIGSPVSYLDLEFFEEKAYVESLEKTMRMDPSMIEYLMMDFTVSAEMSSEHLLPSLSSVVAHAGLHVIRARSRKLLACLQVVRAGSDKNNPIYDDLKPGGADIPVTGENLGEYIELVSCHRMLNPIKDKLGAFLTGIFEIVPEPLISAFTFQEVCAV